MYSESTHTWAKQGLHAGTSSKVHEIQVPLSSLYPAFRTAHPASLLTLFRGRPRSGSAVQTLWPGQWDLGLKRRLWAQEDCLSLGVYEHTWACQDCLGQGSKCGQREGWTAKSRWNEDSWRWRCWGDEQERELSVKVLWPSPQRGRRPCIWKLQDSLMMMTMMIKQKYLIREKRRYVTYVNYET